MPFKTLVHPLNSELFSSLLFFLVPSPSRLSLCRLMRCNARIGGSGQNLNQIVAWPIFRFLLLSFHSSGRMFHCLRVGNQNARCLFVQSRHEWLLFFLYCRRVLKIRGSFVKCDTYVAFVICYCRTEKKSCWNINIYTSLFAFYLLFVYHAQALSCDTAKLLYSSERKNHHVEIPLKPWNN
jgi:hypothetical protein